MGTSDRYELPWPNAVGVPPDGPYALQQLAQATDTALGEVEDGIEETFDTLGVRAFHAQSVSFPGPAGGAGSAAYTDVTWPVGKFTAAPSVTVSMASAPGGSGYYVPRAISVTSSGCRVYVYTMGASGGATATVAVHAVQMA